MCFNHCRETKFSAKKLVVLSSKKSTINVNLNKESAYLNGAQLRDYYTKYQNHIDSDNFSPEEMTTSAKRLKLNNLTGEDTFFDHLPDEVQLKIFKFLEIEDLIRCAQVSKRTRRICHDESIWKKVNLFRKVVPSEFIVMILENGCKYINLQSSKIVGSLNLSGNNYNVKFIMQNSRSHVQSIREITTLCMYVATGTADDFANHKIAF